STSQKLTGFSMIEELSTAYWHTTEASAANRRSATAWTLPSSSERTKQCSTNGSPRNVLHRWTPSATMCVMQSDTLQVPTMIGMIAPQVSGSLLSTSMATSSMPSNPTNRNPATATCSPHRFKKQSPRQNVTAQLRCLDSDKSASVIAALISAIVREFLLPMQPASSARFWK